MTKLAMRRSPSLWTWLHDSYYHPMSLYEELEPWTYEWSYGWKSYPWLEVYEYKGDLWVKLDLPGLKKEDFKISIEGDYLTIWAERKKEEEYKEATYYYRGRWYGTYSRSIYLPWPVDAEKISATYENGTLEIKLPKAEEAKTKQIEVKFE